MTRDNKLSNDMADNERERVGAGKETDDDDIAAEHGSEAPRESRASRVEKVGGRRKIRRGIVNGVQNSARRNSGGRRGRERGRGL